MAARTRWFLAGVLAGILGLGLSHLASALLGTAESPVLAVGQRVIDLTPGAVTERAIRVLGAADKPVLVLAVLAGVTAILAGIGSMARRGLGRPIVAYVVLAGVGAAAVAAGPGGTPYDLIPIAVGFAAWVIGLALLVAPLRPTAEVEGHAGLDAHHRRAFLVRVGLVALVGATSGVVGQYVATSRRHVLNTRRLLRIPGVTQAPTPRGAHLAGLPPWTTPNEDFYRIDTLLVPPTVDPSEWTLRIHGRVARELNLTYQNLLDAERTEAWITLNCVSNDVGGPLIGNAWWSGVRIADLLAVAGVRPEADAVLQTSVDGWNCNTPLSALTDDRGAMLALAMNGEPLPIEHGFPVRMIVPGLYGYVSATKWLVDLEVTRFDEVTAYWTERNWAEQAPVKIASRIDVPEAGDTVPAGEVRFGGVAWHQHTGIAGVQVALNGQDWVDATLSREVSIDTWVQWAVTLAVPPGDHSIKVRAIGADGEVQTGVRRESTPDGATGWHTIIFRAE